MKNSSLNINFKSLLDWKGVLLLIFMLVIFFMQCDNKKNDGKKDVVKIDGKKYNVIKRAQGISYKKNNLVTYRTRDEIYTFIKDYDTILKDIDTAAILKDYFAKYVSIDTLKLQDSLGMITITDTITQNRIWYRTYLASISQKEIHDTIWIDPVKTSNLYFGINGGFTKNQLPGSLGISLILQTPTDRMFGLGVGLQNGPTIAPYVNGSVYWKIKLKK